MKICKYLSLTLSVILCLCIFPLQAGARTIRLALGIAVDLEFDGISASGSGLVAHVSTGNADMVGYMIHQDFTLICEGYESFGGGDVALGAAVSHMKSGSYKVTVWGSDASGSNTGEFFTFDVTIAGGFSTSDITPQSSPSGLQPGQEELTAVKTPQAAIYSDRSLSNQAYSLKQYDRLFYKETLNPLVYYVYGYWIDGVPDIQEGGGSGGYDIITNTVWFDGYMYANSVLSHAFGEELPKEIVNLAYTRLGLQGIYSQHDRWTQYSQDCSSFVYWVYREFGIPLGFATADGEVQWHLDTLADTPGVVVWSSADQYEVITGRQYYNEDGDAVTAVKFEYVDPNIIDSLEPGDTLFFNWFEDLHYYDSHGDRQEVSYQVNQGNTYGTDHTGIYIGEGQYIHASGPEVNTIISPLLPDLQSVFLIGRPAETAS